MTYRQWRDEVDKHMRRDYGIDTVDAGLDHDYLVQPYRQGLSPQEFVDWLGDKYALTKMQGAYYGTSA